MKDFVDIIVDKYIHKIDIINNVNVVCDSGYGQGEIEAMRKGTNTMESNLWFSF